MTPISSRCVVVRCSVMQCNAVWCSMLQYVAVCCSILQYASVCRSVLHYSAVCCSVLQCITVWIGACIHPKKNHKKNRRLHVLATPLLFLDQNFRALAAPYIDAVCITLFNTTHKHTATHCNTLQYIATHYNTQQNNCSALHWRSMHSTIQYHTQTYCNTMQYIAMHCNTLQYTAKHCSAPYWRSVHSTIQHHTATYCNTLQYTAIHRMTLQYTAKHCIALQHYISPCKNPFQSHFSTTTTKTQQFGNAQRNSQQMHVVPH